MVSFFSCDLDALEVTHFEESPLQRNDSYLEF